MSLKWRLKDNCQKNKRQRYDICRVLGVTLRDKEHRCEIIKALASSHFSESRDPSYVSSAIYPESPRKEWRAKSFGIQSNVHWRLVYLVRDGFLHCFCLLAESYATINHYQSTPTGKLPKVRPRTRWRDYCTAPTLLGPVLVWSEQNYTCWTWGILVILGLLSSRLSPKEKRVRKWVDEYVGLLWTFVFMKLSLVCLPKVNVVFK